jgi:hypothetical protein
MLLKHTSKVQNNSKLALSKNSPHFVLKQRAILDRANFELFWTFEVC